MAQLHIDLAGQAGIKQAKRDRTLRAPLSGARRLPQHRRDRLNRMGRVKIDPQARAPRLSHRPIHRLYRAAKQFELLGLHRRLNAQNNLRARLKMFAGRLQRVAEHSGLKSASCIAELHKGKSIAPRRFSLLPPGHNPGQFRNQRALFRFFTHLVQRNDPRAFERGHIVIQRMTGQVKANRLKLFCQLLRRQPFGQGRQAWLWQIITRLTK